MAHRMALRSVRGTQRVYRTGFLGGSHVFAARTLGALTALERHRLPFPQFRERHACTCGLMEKVLGAVAGGNEPEPFVADESFDGPGHGCHSYCLLAVGRSVLTSSRTR